MTTVRVHRHIYVGRGLVNVPLKRRRWLELIFFILLLTTMTTILVQLVLFCNFSVHSGELKMFFFEKSQFWDDHEIEPVQACCSL